MSDHQLMYLVGYHSQVCQEKSSQEHAESGAQDKGINCSQVALDQPHGCSPDEQCGQRHAVATCEACIEDRDRECDCQQGSIQAISEKRAATMTSRSNIALMSFSGSRLRRISQVAR